MICSRIDDYLGHDMKTVNNILEFQMSRIFVQEAKFKGEITVKENLTFF